MAHYSNELCPGSSPYQNQYSNSAVATARGFRGQWWSLVCDVIHSCRGALHEAPRQRQLVAQTVHWSMVTIAIMMLAIAH